MDRILKINRRRVLIAFLSLLMLLILSYVLFRNFQSKKKYICLYFTDHRGKELFMEKRNIPLSKGLKTEDKARIILNQLFSGPMSYKLESVLNTNARILNLWLVNDFLYINLNSKSFTKDTKGDFAVSSVNKTVFKNFPKINKIKYLVNSRSLSTLSGFEDISFVFLRNKF